GECGVPRPDGDREVEGRDDAGDAARMPGLDHAVFGAFGGDSQAIELARQANGEVANVDHLLNLAEAFGDDLADLDGHETAKCFLVHPQLLSEQADKLAAIGRRRIAPGEKGFLRPLDRLPSLGRTVLVYVGDDLAGYG